MLAAVLACTVAIGLLGLAELLRIWDRRLWDRNNAQFWKYFDWAPWCGFVLLLCVSASVVVFGVYSKADSTQSLLVLLGVHWIYGRLVEVRILAR
jgi:uncharacterized membrane protein YhaH (DUF805 family)